MRYEVGDKVRTRILGADVTTKVREVRDHGVHSQHVLVDVPTNITAMAGIKDPNERVYASNMIRTGMWTFSTALEKV